MVEFLTVLTRRWRFVFACIVLGVGGSAALTYQLTPSFRAESQLFVAIASNEDTTASFTNGVLGSANRVKSYPDLVKSPLVLDPVIDELGLDTTAQELSASIEAEVPPNTVLIQVRVDDSSAQRAADIANAVSLNLITVVEDLDRTSPTKPSPVRVSVVREATPPSSPRTPIPWLNIAVGLLGGLGLGLAAAALREALDTSIKDESDVEEATGLPTLGAVPVNPDISSAPILVQGKSSPVWAESYRKLRTNISYLDPDNPPRTLLVTSALPGDGKTVTAANLAASLSQSGRRTVLVEADLRRPAVGKLLGLVPDVGVTNIVAGKATIEEVTQECSGFSVIASGPIPPNPSELLGSHAFQHLTEELLTKYDNVIIDTPPLIAVTDAAVAAASADAVIVVCQAKRTKKRDLRRALYGLRAVDANVVGVVINKVTISGGSYYQYEYRSPAVRKASKNQGV